MTFLPIVERELRVSARRRGTYWTRVVIALLSIVIGGCVFVATFELPEAIVGPRIFLGLAIVGMCYCLVAGRRLTVNCLTEEKQEGTLGLLFLTDLKGHDVVLGKLAATSLNGFFSLLALLPVLAVPLMMGGTSNGQFWRTALVLVSTFLFSLAIGIYGSAAYRTTKGAATANLLLLLLFVGGPIALAFSEAFLGSGPLATRPDVSVPYFTSPIFAFVMSFDVPYRLQPSGYWGSICVINLLTFLLVYRAGRVVPDSWRERLTPKPEIAPARVLQRTLSFEEAAKRKSHRKRLLDVNAFYWLALRQPNKAMRAWIFLGCMGAWWVWGYFTSGAYWFDSGVKLTAALILNVTFKLWIALEAGQQLAEDKKAGSLELLLSSPLTVRDIIHGQWLALRRQFAGPLLAVSLFEIFFLLTTPEGIPEYKHEVLWILIIAGLVMFMADAAALFWVGMYQAMAARNPVYAGTFTISRILVLPWILLVLIGISLGFRAAVLGEPAPGWKFYLALWFSLGLLTDAVFGFLAWYRLRKDFRQLAGERFSGDNFLLLGREQKETAASSKGDR